MENLVTLPASSRDHIPSPLETHLPHLSSAEIASLPYPPDIFPGARDVSTSFGPMRVYEWGKEDGRKVMLIHGDATAAPVWKRIADALVDKGCRVIVLDLWGRGYSSTPLVPHDTRLLSLQLLFAASSSPLPWCSESFSVIGFSLGGGIAMDFVASFPHLVRSVVLLGPAGLLRDLPEDYVGLKRAADRGASKHELMPMIAAALGVEDGDEPAIDAAQPADIDSRAQRNAAALVRWAFKHHDGNATSFVSTLQHGPVQDQHATWKRACKVIRGKYASQELAEKLLVVCGKEDGVVPGNHVAEDLDDFLGRDNYVFREVPGNHGFPLRVDACEQIVAYIADQWLL